MAFALAPELPDRIAPPALIAPAPREVSFGRVAGTVSPGTDQVVVLVDGEELGELEVEGRRFELNVSLPPRNATIRVVVDDGFGNRAERSVGPVFGLPRAAAPTETASYEDPELRRRINALIREFPGISGIYVENLRTGAGAAWNARARFPAASSVKIAIAIEVLRVLGERPPPASSLDRLLKLMLIRSDNEAANELLAWLGGSESGGAEQVNALMGALGLPDTHLFGGYLIAAGRREIPLTVESQPAFEGKYTTAWDLAQLHRLVHLATQGEGPLVNDIDGSFTPADARFLLWVLVHSADRGKLDRYVEDDVVVAHKAGWISEARHDSGLVYSPDGVFVASVMTWTGGGAGEASDELAGRIAEAALERFGDEGTTASLAKSFSFVF